MEKSLIRKEVAPFLAMFALLVVATFVGDVLLHAFGLVWVGRWLGIPGTLLILLSFLYTLRKRRVIAGGSPSLFLRAHEALTWLGALMVLVHAGIHFTAILPWLALIAMLVNIVSGMTGKFLLDRGRRHLTQKKQLFQQRGLSDRESEVEVFWDATTLDVMAKWRKVHFPVTLAFAVLTTGHILSILMFWNWR